MRVTNLSTDVTNDVQQSEQTLQTALQQLTTGRRVNQPSDDPAASSEFVKNQTESANVDQYTKNAASVQSQVQTADAALSSVLASLNKAVTLGTQGANQALSGTSRQSVISELQGIVSSVVAQANTAYGGTYLFGGTASAAPPFTVNAGSATGYQYNGNSNVNSVAVGDNLSTPVNVPGDQIFTNSTTNVLGSITGLVSALQSGNAAQINVAIQGITTAVNYVSEQRVTYSNISTQLDSQESYLSQETITLAGQAISLVGINTAVAATNLSQAELSNNAVLAAAAKVLPNTLLNYLK